MKKIIITVLSAMAILGACTKIEDTANERFKNLTSEIVFNTKAGATKAIVEGTAMVDNFGVYGYVVKGDYSDGGYIMKNAEYDKDGNAVNGPYYWPKSDNNQGINFIFTAYSQFETPFTWENDVLKLAIPKLTQDLIDNPDDFNDVLWAQTSVNQHQDGNVNATHERVNLNFKHALSWIQFNGEVTNPNVKWAKVKQISFGEYKAAIDAVEYQPATPAVNDTSYTWNVKISAGIACRSTSPTKVPITNEDIAYINSWFTTSLGTWPTSSNAGYFIVTPVTENIPDEYKTTVTTVSNKNITVFDARKYLNAQHPGTNWGGNWGTDAQYGHIIAHLDKPNDYHRAWALNPFQNEIETITEITPAKPEVPGVDAVPAHGSDGIYTDGVLSLPTASLITVSPVVTITEGAQKDTVINYLKAQEQTINTNENKVLGDALIIPQSVPEKITIVFDICISNPDGDEVVFTDRKITRVINAGNDMKDVAYVASWLASNKYIYNFKFDGDVVDFTIKVDDWTTNSANEYHVWDY